MAKYRKKPVVVEAVQWKGNNRKEVKSEVGLDGCDYSVEPSVNNPEGERPVNVLIMMSFGGKTGVFPGEWIIKGIDGKLYPMKPDIFAATYELVEEN